MSGVRYAVRDGRVLVPVKVVPGASRSRVVGVLGDRWKIAVAAPPARGAANREACEVLAAALGVKASAVAVVDGLSSPRKTVAVAGRTANAVHAALAVAAR